MFRRAGCAQGDVEHGFARWDEIARVLAQSMAHAGDTRFCHEVAPPKLVRPGAIGIPGKPIMTDFERRSIREVERSCCEPLHLGDGLTDFCRQIPAATPLV